MKKVINGVQNCHPVEVANFTFSQPSDFQEIRALFSCYQNVYLLIMEIVPNFLVLIIIIFVYGRE